MNKKSLILCLAMMILPLLASAHDFEVGGIYYNITSDADKTAEVTYKGDSYDSYHDEYSGSITIPATVTHNGTQYSVTSIGEYAFRDCSSLTAINIPENSQLTSIGTYAFRDCSSLTAINIPESVTSIKSYAFDGCSSLTSITIPKGVTSIGYSPFSDCSSLTSIIVEEENEVYDSRNGCNAIIKTNDNTLIQGCSTTIIPESVTSIEYNAFCHCSNLTAINIPESVTSIGQSAFAYCSSLTSIIIPESVTSIKDHTFRDCALTSITLPKGMTSIGRYAFLYCRSLTSIICKATTPPTIGDYHTFYGVSKSIPVYVPVGSMEAYKAAEHWSEFSNIQPLIIDIAAIILNQSSATLLEGESITLTATISPDDATDGSLTWSSSNEDVAMVSSKGKVITLAAGITTITATANDGSGVSASCEVRVVLGKCEAPTINYVDGKVLLTCDTEEAKVITTTTDCNANKFEEFKFDFIPTYTLTAYATKANYEDSDVATLTLCWIPCDENHEESDGIVTIPSKPVLISARDGVLTVSGLAEGTEVTLYTTDGAMVAHQQSYAGEAKFTVDTNQVYLVHIGDKVVKIGM